MRGQRRDGTRKGDSLFDQITALRREGYKWREIAERLYYANDRVAYKTYREMRRVRGVL